ncbi:DUF805 domain-containing protein [Tenacibaculum sp. E3R01]|uniref:DUF805 domain-containing protein n=1 Tax=Tenacibaculum sp. E3R01 TaxID=2267227 RepID=UPI000DE97882|nr:DUF805 domain-containing protein [Tenacibaculum sp. E3R01]RBW56346.1 DUF805 domain-containing protein [Tenacibaculum sp. E3R01]
MNWYVKVLKQYVDFSGRARREEYWMFTLINLLISWGAMGISIGLDIPVLAILLNLYSLAVFLPSLAVAVRRLHDVGKSGWNILIALIPLVGAIILLVWLCTDSDHGKNKWGDNPKGIGNDHAINNIGKE